MIRVLVADDQAAVRHRFAALIDAQENMQIAATAANGRQAIEKARRTFPHVILMDIRPRAGLKRLHSTSRSG